MNLTFSVILPPGHYLIFCSLTVCSLVYFYFADQMCVVFLLSCVKLYRYGAGWCWFVSNYVVFWQWHGRFMQVECVALKFKA